MKIYHHDAGQITKMAAMPIYGKQPLQNLLRTHCHEFGMYHRGLMLIIFCLNDDP